MCQQITLSWVADPYMSRIFANTLKKGFTVWLFVVNILPRTDLSSYWPHFECLFSTKWRVSYPGFLCFTRCILEHVAKFVLQPLEENH